MSDVSGLLHSVMNSPWIYLAVFVFVTIDGFFPTIPGETLVVTAGVFAAGGHPNLLAVILVAALAGLTGDHISYLIGRTAGGRLVARLRPDSRSYRHFDWARRALRERGNTVLIICRFIPGSRTATTITTGTIRFPLRSFALFTGLGSLCWSSYFTMVGYLGGLTFQRHPLLGVLLGIAVGVLMAALIEGSHRLRGGDAHARDGGVSVPTGQE